jgi:hypothetical protein
MRAGDAFVSTHGKNIQRSPTPTSSHFIRFLFRSCIASFRDDTQGTFFHIVVKDSLDSLLYLRGGNKVRIVNISFSDGLRQVV